MRVGYSVCAMLAVALGCLSACKKDEPHKGNEKDWGPELAGVYSSRCDLRLENDSEILRQNEVGFVTSSLSISRLSIVPEGDREISIYMDCSAFSGTFRLKQVECDAESATYRLIPEGGTHFNINGCLESSNYGSGSRFWISCMLSSIEVLSCRGAYAKKRIEKERESEPYFMISLEVKMAFSEITLRGESGLERLPGSHTYGGVMTLWMWKNRSVR